MHQITKSTNKMVSRQCLLALANISQGQREELSHFCNDAYYKSCFSAEILCIEGEDSVLMLENKKQDADATLGLGPGKPGKSGNPKPAGGKRKSKDITGYKWVQGALPSSLRAQACKQRAPGDVPIKKREARVGSN